MLPLTVTLPGTPPSVNKRYRRGYNGRLVLTDETRAWQAGAALVIGAEATARGWAVGRRTPLVVTLCLVTPHLWKSDLDNVLKCVGDALAAALFINDCYIVAWHVEKCRGKAAETRISIAPAPEAA